MCQENWYEIEDEAIKSSVALTRPDYLHLERVRLRRKMLDL
jgi:hypothetical protein